MVGNFVNTNALAAVGASTPVINMLVGFFMGLSTGAGVVISQYFGARQGEAMSRAVHSAMALTGLLSIVFTGLGWDCCIQGPFSGQSGCRRTSFPILLYI